MLDRSRQALQRPPPARQPRLKSEPCSARARWQRAWRRRRAAGVMVVPVEIDAAVLDLLITTGWLAELEAGDKAAIGRAIAAMLKDAARR